MHLMNELTTMAGVSEECSIMVEEKPFTMVMATEYIYYCFAYLLVHYY